MYGSNITAKRYMAHSCQGRQGHKNYCYPSFIHFWGWFGGCEAVVYLMSPRRPTDIGLQLGKGQLSLRRWKRGTGKSEKCFHFFCFFTFLSFLFLFLPRLSFISSIISCISFLPFSGRQQKMTHKGLCVVKLQHNQSIIHPLSGEMTL